MRVIYEDLSPGVSVELEQVKLLSKQDRPKYNRRGRYLYSEISYRFSATYNPASTSAKYSGNNIVVKEGYNPFITEEALRYYLEQPRKRFKWLDDDGNSVLVVPQPKYVTDAHNGPLPTVLSATEVVGSGTILIEWMITVHLNEVSKFTDEPVLLEHEWEASHSIDELYFTTRTLIGRVDFNTANLEKNSFVPDDYRQHLFPPPPNGYKRIKVDVTAQEDGSSLIYTVVDREQRCSLKRRGIAKVELVQKAGVKSNAGVDAALNLVAGGISLANSIRGALDAELVAQAAAATAAGTPLAGAAVLALPMAAIISKDSLDWIKTNVPVKISNIVIKVYGTPETPFAVIRSAAYEIARYRIGEFGVRSAFLNTEINETHIVHEGIVELSVSHMSGIGQQILDLSNNTLNLLGAPAGTVASIDNLMTTDNNIEPSIGEWSYRSPVPGASTTPTDNGSRGTRLAAAVTQSLSDATSKPNKSSSRIRNRRTTTDPQS